MRIQENKLGQTMLETIIAFSMIIFFLSGIVVIELYAVRNAQFSKHKSQATKLARQQLERARVIRDSAGFEALETFCSSTCYINSELTPMPFTMPTGTYGLSLTVSGSADCEGPEVSITPAPTIYKVVAHAYWPSGATITPVQQVELSSCLTDWR